MVNCVLAFRSAFFHTRGKLSCTAMPVSAAVDLACEETSVSSFSAVALDLFSVSDFLFAACLFFLVLRCTRQTTCNFVSQVRGCGLS